MSAPEWKAGDRAVVEVAEAADQHGWVKVKSPAYIHNLVPASALSPLPAGGLGPVTPAEGDIAWRAWSTYSPHALYGAATAAANAVLAARATRQPGVDAEGLAKALRTAWVDSGGHSSFTSRWTAVARAALRECGRVEAPTVADPYEAALCVREDAQPPRPSQIAEANARVAEAAEVARLSNRWTQAENGGLRPSKEQEELEAALSARRAILAPAPAPDAVGELVAAIDEIVVFAEHAEKNTIPPADRAEVRRRIHRLRAALAAVKAQKEAK